MAEQFAALEAFAPGRIDLGIGRAPGSDPVITQLLRISGPTADVDRFPDHIADILSLLSPDGASLRLTSGRMGRFVRSRAIECSCGNARARASSAVGATDAFTVRNVSGAGCASLGRYSVR